MKTIIEMAREAGFVLAGKFTTRIHGYDRDGDYTEELEHFAALVRADEREACAKQRDHWKALAQPVQEPVAYIRKDVNGDKDLIWSIDEDLEESFFGYTPLYTTPPLPVQDEAAIRADEREACAKVCEDAWTRHACASAIRARGQA